MSTLEGPINLTKERVFILKDKLPKRDIIAMLVNAAAQNTAVDVRAALKNVLKREDGISTVLESGLAIPHARVEGLSGFEAAVAIPPPGYTDENGLAVKVVLLFLSPAEQAYFSAHLKLLAHLAEKFTPQFTDYIAGLNNPSAIAQKITNE